MVQSCQSAQKCIHKCVAPLSIEVVFNVTARGGGGAHEDSQQVAVLLMRPNPPCSVTDMMELNPVCWNNMPNQTMFNNVWNASHGIDPLKTTFCELFIFLIF